MSLFREGDTVVSVFNTGEGIQYTAGVGNVESITVSMQPGHMAHLPWFVVEFVSGGRTAINADHVSSVRLSGEK